MNKKYEWPVIKGTYVVGYKMTLKEIAENYGIPYQTVRREAAKENWIGCRLLYQHFNIYCESAVEQRRVFRKMMLQEERKLLNDW